MKTLFSDKMSKGLVPSEADWNQHLREAHRQAPRMTPAVFASHTTSSGFTSYEILAATLNRLQTLAPNVVDLACGDGHLIQHLLPKLGAGKITGVDMSEDELDFARRTYACEASVEFVCARADQLPFSDASVDSVLCHMAFMLMVPVEPVVAELARVLKPGGVFSAVVGRPKGAKGFFVEIQRTVAEHVHLAFPNIAQAKTGDPRVNSLETLSEIFPPTQFEGICPYSDLDIKVHTTPGGVWEFMRNMYLVEALPSATKTDLKKALITQATVAQGAQSHISFDFPLKLFGVVRR